MADPVKELVGLITGVAIPTWWSVRRRRAMRLAAQDTRRVPAVSFECPSPQLWKEKRRKQLDSGRLILGRTIVLAGACFGLLAYVAVGWLGLSESWASYRDSLVAVWAAVVVDLELALVVVSSAAGLWVYRNTPGRSARRAFLGGALIVVWLALILRLISEGMLVLLRVGEFDGASGVRDWLVYRIAMHRAWHLVGLLVIATCALALYRRVSSEPPVSPAPTPSGGTRGAGGTRS